MHIVAARAPRAIRVLAAFAREVACRKDPARLETVANTGRQIGRIDITLGSGDGSRHAASEVPALSVGCHPSLASHAEPMVVVSVSSDGIAAAPAVPRSSAASTAEHPPDSRTKRVVARLSWLELPCSVLPKCAPAPPRSNCPPRISRDACLRTAATRSARPGGRQQPQGKRDRGAHGEQDTATPRARTAC